MTNMEALLETLKFRDDWCKEFPLHGIANEALAGHGSHQYQICIMLRALSTNAHEQLADLKVTKELEGRFGPKRVFNVEIHDTNRDEMLQRAARALASYLLVEVVRGGVESLAVTDF
jgi:hypothetical protein